MFSIKALRIAANAAHNFPPGYDRTTFYQGKPCPAMAMSCGGFPYQFNQMCELVHAAAGYPPVDDAWGRDAINTPTHTSHMLWFQTMLHENPRFLGKMFDTIILCASAAPSASPSIHPSHTPAAALVAAAA